MMKQKKSFLDKIAGEGDGLPGGSGIAVQDERNNYMTEEDSGGRTEEMERQWESEEEEEDGQLAIDVYQDDDFVIIKSIVGGIRPEDLDVSVTSDMVTIKGSRGRNEEIKKENYYYQECFWGNFSRSVILPCDIKADQVEASMKNGILTVRMPKVEKNSSTRIEVRGE